MDPVSPVPGLLPLRPGHPDSLATNQRIARHYQLYCRRCGANWDAAYEVVVFCDAEGVHELYFHHGLPATAPWSISCPAFSGQRVAVLPFRAQAAKLRATGRSDREMQRA
jgi:hypothetical protein